MAVSPTDYTKYSTKCQMLSTSVQDKVGNLFALALTAYGSDNNFKNLFFCDAIVSWVDTDNKPCIIGLCRENSDNYNHHAAARRSYIRVGFGGANNSLDAFVAMNDAGLNTMPHIDFVATPTFVTPDLIAINVLYQNAYYLNTHQPASNGFAITILYGSGYANTFTVPLSALNTTAGASSPSVQIAVTSLPSLTVGEYIKLRLSAKNDEGTYVQADTAPIQVLQRLCILQVQKINAPSDNPTTGATYTIYLEEDYYDNLPSSDEKYPTLYNIFQNINTDISSQVFIHGVSGNQVTDSILTTYLPDGLYYGFPNDFFIPGVTTNPPDTDKIIYIRSNVLGAGQAYRYTNSTYVPPTPTALTAVGAAFYTSGTYSPMYDQINQIETVFPHVTLTGNGNVGATVVVYYRERQASDTPWTQVFTQVVDISLGSTPTTGTIPIGFGGGTGELPSVDFPYDSNSIYDTEVRIEVYNTQYGVSDSQDYVVDPAGRLSPI